MNQSTETSRKPARMLVERPDIQELSIDAIVVDDAFQSRIATDPEHVLVFDEMIRNGMEIHPVVVFWTGERYILADGFHRYHAHKKRLGVRSIRAEIKQGSERDAMIYSAGANRLSIKSPSHADRKKAAFMLFADPDWWAKTNAEIGAHVGTAKSNITTYRGIYGAENGIPSRRRDGGVHRVKGRGEKWEYRAYRKDKTFHLGTDELAAKKKWEAMQSQLKETRLGVSCLGNVARKMKVSGIPCEPLPMHGGAKITIRIGGNFCLDAADAASVDSIRKAILNVLLIRESRDSIDRAVVICYRNDANAYSTFLIDMARKLNVEFLTPDEFISSVKTD